MKSGDDPAKIFMEVDEIGEVFASLGVDKGRRECVHEFT